MMPSILGFEGLNHLNVYYRYNTFNFLKFFVLQVCDRLVNLKPEVHLSPFHNAFGEGYVLEVGISRTTIKDEGEILYRWPFFLLPVSIKQRSPMNFSWNFFVSPPNDRTGFYTIAVKAPSLPHSTSGWLDLYISDPGKTDANVTHKQKTHGVGPLQLTAPLRINISSPLTTHNLVLTLLTHFLALFSTLPQILYHALILRYRKRFDIWQNQIRPFGNQASNRRESYGKRKTVLRSTSRNVSIPSSVVMPGSSHRCNPLFGKSFRSVYSPGPVITCIWQA
jgi:hypothetical protein